MSPPTFSFEVMLREVRREIGKREQVYPRMIGRGDMTVEEARRRTDIMRAVADHLSKEAAKERLL